MPIEVLRCPNCAAPLPPGSRDGFVCTYCGHTLTNIKGAGSLRWDGPERGPDDGLPRVHVDRHSYALVGRVARGESSDVFLARRDTRLTEQVLVKVLRATSDADLLAREWRVIEALHASDAQGGDYFQKLLPQPIAFAKVTGVGVDPRPAAVYRWRSGFLHTLDDVRAAYPDGIDPGAAIWMWKRLLETLGWVHRAGYAHGAVVPGHVIVHPRDHGVVLAGWSCAVRGETLPARVERARAFYPDDAWQCGSVTPATDLVMAARCIAWALGGDPAEGTVPSSVAAPIAELVRAYATMSRAKPADDAWEMIERVSAVGKAVFGAPKFIPFKMPGWR